MKREAFVFIATKMVLVENQDLFTDDEMKIIRGGSFISCVKENEVCLSTNAVAKLAHKSQTTVRNWCMQNKINCYRDSRGSSSQWYEIPLRTVVDLKKTNWDMNEVIPLDIKKVDF